MALNVSRNISHCLKFKSTDSPPPCWSAIGQDLSEPTRAAELTWPSCSSSPGKTRPGGKRCHCSCRSSFLVRTPQRSRGGGTPHLAWLFRVCRPTLPEYGTKSWYNSTTPRQTIQTDLTTDTPTVNSLRKPNEAVAQLVLQCRVRSFFNSSRFIDSL